MNRISILVILVFMLYAATNASAQGQNYKFEHIGRDQGLTAGSVLSIIQDHKGFMWFGTTDGLFRYDGYGMNKHKHDPLDSTSLGNNNVFAILEDREHRLWIGTAGGGLNRFDCKTETFVRYKHQPDNPESFSADVVSALYEDSDGNLWAGTWAGLNRLEPHSGKITRFVNDPQNPRSMNPHWIRAICQDHSGAVWVATDGGICRLDQKSGEFTHFIEDRDNPQSLSSNAVNSVFEDSKGRIWAGTWGGLDRFDHEQEHFTNISTGGRVAAILEDRSGALWIGTDHHLLHFDRKSNQYTRFVHDLQDPYSLSNNEVQTIYEDRTGALWIGTTDGAARLDCEQYQVKQITDDDPDEANQLNFTSVSSLCEDPTGSLWIAGASPTENGLKFVIDRLDPKTGRLTHAFPGLEEEVLPTNLRINSICCDKFGMLWIGMWSGLGRYDPETEKFVQFTPDPADQRSLSSNHVWRIHEDRAGRIWVATIQEGPSGIDRFDRKNERFSHFILTPKAASGFSQRNGVHSISEGKNGRLWFATMGDGIFLLNPGSDEFIQYTHDSKDPNSLSHGWVGVVHEDGNGMVWAAPWYGGLNKLDPETGRVTIFTEKHGLASNYITSIVEDDRGHLWMTTLSGLSRFDPQKETFKKFDRTDGLLHNEFNVWNASRKSRTGELYFGGESGLEYLHPDSIRDNPHTPSVVFTKFVRHNSSEASGQAIIERGITDRRGFDLTHQDHTLTFEFSALNYRAPHKNRYAYKLEGFRDDWIHLGNKHDLTLTNLDPGQYALHVKGSNNDGVWNEKGTFLLINIRPPWWRTGWAYGLYAALIGLTLYGVRRFELKRTHLENELEKKHFESEKLKEVDELKSRFFANISHEFRTPLTLIRGPLQQLYSGSFQGNVKELYHLMLRNSDRLLRLINQLLDLSRLESGRIVLHACPEDLISLTRQLTMSFESLAKQKNIKLQFDVAAENHAPVLVYLDRAKYEKIMINLLSNAFKFTPAGGDIKVEVGRTPVVADSNPALEGSVYITVSDTGIGIAPERLPQIFNRFYQVEDVATRGYEGTGIGLSLAKELVELHRGEITATSEVDLGTTFTVRLPFGKAHLRPEEIADSGSQLDDIGFENVPASSGLPSAIRHTAPKSEIVLIVEDNPDMRAYLWGCLQAQYAIKEAENGVAGLKAARKTLPDLIISDVMMPEMDGMVFCSEVKNDPRTSHIPVIMLTAKAAQQDRLEGLETGADDYLIKPFDANELNVRVKNLIEQRRRLRERFSGELLIQPAEVTVTSIDAAFLEKVIAAVEAQIDDPAFETDDLARAAAVSRRHLNRKLRALTGQSVRGFIRTLRLKRAAQLLLQRSGTVTEISYEVGFRSIAHFAKVFREQFGVSPSSYANKE